MQKKNYYIKANRIFNPIRKYGWIVTVLVALGGLWEPKLGLAVLFIMAALTITAFFSGRYWCGNICPHGSLFDKIILPVSANKKIPKFFKSKLFVISFFIFFVVNFIRKIINVTQAWGTYDFFDKLGSLFSNTYLMVLIVGGALAIFINSRTWCQFCPMGTMQKLSHSLGKKLGIAKKTENKVTVSDKDKCIKCGKCARVCPFQLEPYKEFSDKDQFDHPDCIKCNTCVVNCPVKILSLEKENEIKIGEVTEEEVA